MVASNLIDWQKLLEGFHAVVTYILVSNQVPVEFLDLLVWALESISSWNLDLHTNPTGLINEWTFAIIKASHGEKGLGKIYSQKIGQIFARYVESMTLDSFNLDIGSKALSGLLAGLTRSIDFMHPEVAAAVVKDCIGLLGSEVFDLRLFLKDVPPNSCVDEILNRHYGLLQSLLAFLASIVPTLMRPGGRLPGLSELSDSLRWLLIEYLQAIITCLSTASSQEKFLYGVFSLAVDIVAGGIQLQPRDLQTSAACVAEAMKVWEGIETTDQLAHIVEPACKLLYSFARE